MRIVLCANSLICKPDQIRDALVGYGYSPSNGFADKLISSIVDAERCISILDMSKSVRIHFSPGGGL